LSESFFKIKGVVQHYAWGGYEFIPALLKMDNAAQKPFAEYWLGVHPNHPSRREDQQRLDEYLEKNPLPKRENAQGDPYALPYLMKVLDVRQMLSIQVHPDKAGAAKGFEEEERAGIPLNASHRNYKDRNHKPEMMVALGDFYLLHGFKAPEKIRETISRTPELEPILEYFEGNNYRKMYESLMRMPQEKVNELLSALSSRVLPAYEASQLSIENEDFWAARAIKDFCSNGHYDRGIFSIYLFNLVMLKKGEGIFQDHGLPHAYLEGRNIEVMATSDNVLRAGLTEKHIDVEKLLLHVKCEPVIPVILKPAASVHEVYKVPAREFELHHYLINGESTTIEAGAGEIWFIEKGQAELESSGGKLRLSEGESLFVASHTGFRLQPQGKLSLYRVLIPGG
jgi:mannose-6-phosphate isomerase